MLSLSQILLIGSVLLFPGQMTGETPDAPQAPAAAVSPSAAGAPGLVWTEPGPTGLTATSVSRAPVRPVAGQRFEGFEFPEARTLDVSYVGPKTLVRQMVGGLVRPTALAAADFDGDGTPEMVAGYTGLAGHIVALHPGNPDAIHPHSPGARARKAAGSFTDAPFLTPARLHGAAVAPDFMAAGDFDGDGHQDVVLASRGGTKLHLLAGDGQGGLSAGRSVTLPGPLTVLASGEINLRDLRPDLAVGVTTEDGPALLIFEARPGALEAVPELIELSAPAVGLAFGQLDDRGFFDLAVAAGNDVLLVEGRNRKTFLRAELRGEIEAARIGSIASLDSPIRSIATGDYVWQDGARRNELALLTSDGSLHVIGRETAEAWSTLGQRQVTGSVGAGGSLLVTARVSGLPLEEVVVLDRAGKKLAAALGDVPAEGQRAAGELPVPLVGTLDRAPVAVLPMRLDRNNLNDVVMLQDGLTAPAVSAAVAAIITVTDGGVDAGPVPNGLCSLSEALDNANLDVPHHADCPGGTGPGDVIDFFIGGGGFAVTIPVAPIGGAASYGSTYEMNGPGSDVIDGFSQGCPFGPCIGLDGLPFAAPGNGLRIVSAGNAVRGLAIHGFPGSGIQLRGTLGNIVEGNFLGLDVGALPSGNGASGITLIDSANNTIGGPAGPPPFPGNTISSNALDGVSVIETAIGLGGSNAVIFNFAGTDPLGGATLGNGALGISLTDTDDNGVFNNLVSGNASDGIGTTVGASAADFNVFNRNTVGTDIGATLAIPNLLSGIRLEGGEGNVIIDNVVSGNTVHGIHTLASAAGFSPFANTIDGNTVGLDGIGTVALGNGGLGVAMFDSPDNFVINNTVSANGSYGIGIGSFPGFGPGSADSNLVADNVAGLDALGMGILLGNTFSGILMQDASFTDVAGNTSSGNGFIGGYGHGAEIAPLNFSPFDSVGNTIRGNRLGTDVFGVGDLGNLLEGVRIADSNDNLVGGPLDTDRNFLCGNDFSGGTIVDFAGAGASGNRFENNGIGEDASGAPVANFLGLFIQDSSDNVIGGASPGLGNRIRNNTATGVIISNAAPFPTLGNLVRHNSIADNLAIGIDLFNDGVTPNDGALDPDIGPNGLQNFPTMSGVFVGLSDTVIFGSVDSLPGATFDIEFFANGACDPSLFGEGDLFVGHDSVTTNAAGVGGFTAILPSAAPVGSLLTATATGPEGTSEFSECIPVIPCPPLLPFIQTIAAPDKTKLAWPNPVDIKFVEGPLSGVGSYTFTGSGAVENTTEISTGGNPPAGTGRYWVVREWGCQSWQTVVGNEPGRDLSLP